MAKLHEILSVEAGLKTTGENAMDEGTNTFTKKHSHFEGHSKTYKARNDEDTEKLNDDVKTIVTTVPDKLEYIKGPVIRLLDCMYQKEQANTTAKADIIIQKDDGSTEENGIFL